MVDTNNDTVYIVTLLRIGQDIGSLFYLDNWSFGEIDCSVWGNNNTSFPAVPLSMQLHEGKFFVGGLAWTEVIAETGTTGVETFDPMNVP